MLTCFSRSDESCFEKQYDNLDDMEEAIQSYKHTNSVYISLSTVEDGKARSKENVMTRCVLAWDFDKKDFEEGFTHRDVVTRFQKAGVYYHMMVDSGRGYHVYIAIEPTDDIEKAIEVTTAIGNKVGADTHAMLPTQLLRVPESYNYKDGKKKKCNLMWLNDPDSRAREYNLDELYKKHCNKRIKPNVEYAASEKMPPCMSSIMEGVAEGHRNFALGRVTKWFQRLNYSKPKTYEIVKEWNSQCTPPEREKKLEICFNGYWDKDYKLLGCRTENKEIQGILNSYCSKSECNKLDKYEIIHADKTVNIEYKIADKIRYRGDNVMLSGNHIAVLSILKVNEEGLNTKQLLEELTSTITKKCAMSRATLIKITKELEETGLISSTENKKLKGMKFFKLEDLKSLESEKIVLSYQAVQRYLDGAIGQSALRLYCYMRYRLSRGHNVVQEEIAKDLNIKQNTISEQVKELEKARFLVITTDYSVNPLGANVYEWIL